MKTRNDVVRKSSSFQQTFRVKFVVLTPEFTASRRIIRASPLQVPSASLPLALVFFSPRPLRLLCSRQWTTTKEPHGCTGTNGTMTGNDKGKNQHQLGLCGQMQSLLLCVVDRAVPRISGFTCFDVFGSLLSAFIS